MARKPKNRDTYKTRNKARVAAMNERLAGITSKIVEFDGSPLPASAKSTRSQPRPSRDLAKSTIFSNVYTPIKGYR